MDEDPPPALAVAPQIVANKTNNTITVRASANIVAIIERIAGVVSLMMRALALRTGVTEPNEAWGGTMVVRVRAASSGVM